MGKGKKSVLATLFGFKKQSAGGKPEEEAAGMPHPRYHQETRVRPTDAGEDDEYYYGRYWHADHDIDQKASEFIERVHRGMFANDQDR